MTLMILYTNFSKHIDTMTENDVNFLDTMTEIEMTQNIFERPFLICFLLYKTRRTLLAALFCQKWIIANDKC